MTDSAHEHEPFGTRNPFADIELAAKHLNRLQLSLKILWSDLYGGIFFERPAKELPASIVATENAVAPLQSSFDKHAFGEYSIGDRVCEPTVSEAILKAARTTLRFIEDGAKPPFSVSLGGWFKLADFNKLETQIECSIRKLTLAREAERKEADRSNGEGDPLIGLEDIADALFVGRRSISKEQQAEWGVPEVEHSGRRARKWRFSKVAPKLKEKYPRCTASIDALKQKKDV